MTPGWEQTVWDYIAITACGLGLIPILLFMIEYQRRSRGAWWRQPDGSPNPFGRYLMTTMGLKACLFTLAVVNRIFSGWWGHEQVTALVLVAFVLSLFLPYRLLLEAQRERTRLDRERNR